MSWKTITYPIYLTLSTDFLKGNKLGDFHFYHTQLVHIQYHKRYFEKVFA